MNLEQLTDAVLQRLQQGKPRALLIGKLQEIDHNYNYVNEKPYEAVVLGTLTPGQLLQMPTDAVCCALLEGVPVYLSSRQMWHGSKRAKALCRELAAAEQRLFRLGVIPLEQPDHLITATRARELTRLGQTPKPGCRMTPLARDILEGKAP